MTPWIRKYKLSNRAGLSEEFPPNAPNEYCNEQGRDVIRGFIREMGS